MKELPRSIAFVEARKEHPVRKELLNLDEITRELKERRAALLSRLEVKGGDSTKAANPDRADLAQAYFLRDRRMALAERIEVTLEQVESALERIETGMYGNCQRCGKNIATARLQALPYAELCIMCQSELEKRN